MQRLWSRVAPTQSTCRCVPCLSTSAPGITSRAATAASRRRLRIGNSVTALYTSIFAAAALADAQAKDKRRHEWAEKIAAVKEEVNELVNEEHRLLEAIQARRSRTLLQGALQKRSFTTWRSIPTPRCHQWLQRNSLRRLVHAPPPRRSVHAVQSADLEDDEEIVDEFQSRKLQEIGEDEGDLDDDTIELEDGFFPEDMEVPKWLSDDIIRQKAIRKLAVKQLAIRLLLRESIAHNYSGIAMDHKADFDMPQLNYSELLSELNKLRRRIRLLKRTEGAYYDDLAHDLRVRSTAELKMERTRLDDEAARDVSLFLRNKMSIQELNLRLANNLLQSSDPDRPFFMKLMILAFTRSMQNDLSDLVLKTVLPHKFPLNSSLIISILTYYKKSKNLKAFDSFLKVLRGEGYPVDLGKLGFYKKMVVNGVEITIPPVASANPVIYTTLITAALRFEQLDRADAWLQAGRKHGFTDDFSTLYAYLKYYAKREDWQNGLYALRRSLAFLTGSTLHSDRHVERLIVHMVQLCDWCGKWDLADAMISAAIDSGFDWSSATTNQLDIQFGRDPRLHYWQKRVDKTTIEKRSRPAWEKAFMFAKLFGEQLEDLGLPENQNPAAHWQKIVALHSREVLSAMSGPLRKLKDAKQTERAPRPNLSRDDFDFVDHDSSDPIEEHEIFAAKKTTREELDILRSEVRDLKEMVYKLRPRFRRNRVASTDNGIETPEGTQDNLQSATVH